MSDKAQKKRMAGNTAIKLSVGAFTVLYLIPVYWVIVTSFKPEMKALSWPPQFIPKKLVLDNYRAVFEFKSIFWYMKNSLIISIGSVFISMVVGSLAAYSFAQLKWKRKTKKNLLLWIVSLKIMPPIAIAIPIFFIFAALKLIDTYIGMIFAYIFFNLPFVIWLAYGFFKDLPKEIIEAALMDGCGIIKMFLKVVIPLTAPGLITVCLLTFMASWNEFLFAVKLTAFNTRTLPVLISGFIIDRGLLWGQLCAVATISVIPVIIVALFIQKYIVSGLTFGAVK
ncbi:MAG TPA: carbohydrate ABC transporter permease [Spirochaetes bacterium]|nr:carbohydrate ABC transporter permease [Spirochaetota bacterium]